MDILQGLHKAEQAATTLFASHTTAKITIRQAVVLAAIQAHPGASQTVLVQHTGVDRSTLADMVRRIVRKGWAVRKRSKDDARAYMVTITGEGVSVLKEAKTTATKTEKELVARIPAVRALANGH